MFAGLSLKPMSCNQNPSEMHDKQLSADDSNVVAPDLLRNMTDRQSELDRQPTCMHEAV